MTVTENGSSEDNKFLDSEFRYTLFPVFYSLVFILGLTGNCCALFVLRKMREAKAINEIRIYMTNLTVADLLFVTALPLWISYYKEHGHWAFSDALCRITGSMFFINTYCSILFLTVISFNRYWAVTQPLDAASCDHRRRGIVVSVVIWATTLSASIPYLVFPGINEHNETGVNIIRCFEGYQNETKEQKWWVAKTHFVIIGFFALVFLLVVICNLLIGRTLMLQQMNKAGRQGWRLKKHALSMVCVVVVVFVVCFVPHHVVQGPWTMAVLGLTHWAEDTQQWLNNVHQITLMLMGLNCLLDPVVYCFATRKFRRYICDHFRKLSRGRMCSRYTASTRASMDSQQHNQIINQVQLRSIEDAPKW
ncbi:platelet-activating factor receptor [Megalops cyprinoides]|uniref:platelet-activating factor receptor n=1 Tax=Megalops cyprinoides TaxID=118141 RepID=UPI001864A5DD|nr:platelet-activating factor receptor [Megalops cyprinoides]